MMSYVLVPSLATWSATNKQVCLHSLVIQRVIHDCAAGDGLCSTLGANCTNELYIYGQLRGERDRGVRNGEV